ncbi:TetR/AcrR family transcriptional regulator [Paenibacillus sp. GCM10027628]|uniref:TetR/AcrR family transcriptional regulator n=1 Tax=Paenibacillus sp. GCM10027628 TaxID=3273413 RepID=UPI00362C27C5
MDVQQEKTTLGRPRSQQAWEAVMHATQTLLRSDGYKNLSMEGIAKAAGVGKPTLYRWWPNVPSIVMEALKKQAENEIGAPNTGSLKSDLLLYLGSTCKSLSEQSGEIMRCLMAEAQFNPDFAQTFREQFIASRRNTLIGILKQGVLRGELQQHADLELLADLCYGPIWYRLLNGHLALDDDFVQALVNQIIPS